MAADAAPEPGSLTGDSSEPGERTWGETPAEFAAEMAALAEADSAKAQPREIWDEPAPVAEESAVADEVVVEAVTVENAVQAAPAEAIAIDEAVEPREEPAVVPPAAASPAVFEDTQPIDVVTEGEDASTGEIAAAEASAQSADGGELPGELPGKLPDEAQEPAPESAAEATAAAASLTLLQRGVDLLNVSRVPRKIAETNEQLGLPHVHAGFDGEVVAVTFMWTMGWYRFNVDLDSGDVGMDDRGYEELTLPPNASVRADGTVQLAPAQISRAAAQRAAQAPPEAAPAQPAPTQPASRRDSVVDPASGRRRPAKPRRSPRSSSASLCSASAATMSRHRGSRPRPATSTGTADARTPCGPRPPDASKAGAASQAAPAFSLLRGRRLLRRAAHAALRTTCPRRRPSSCRRTAGS